MKYDHILSERLTYLLHQAGDISGSELARRVDLPGVTINRLISGSVQDPRISTIQAIADYFQLTPDQLLGIAPLPQGKTIKQTTEIPLSLPCFSLAALVQNTPQPHTQFLWCSDKNDKLAKEKNTLFAVQLQTNHYEPIFKANTFLILDHMRAPQHGDYVLIKRPGESEAILREFFTEGRDHYFYPLRKELPVWPAQKINYKLLGVIIAACVKFHSA